MRIRKIISDDLLAKDKEQLLELFCSTINTVNLGDYSKEQVELWGSRERLQGQWDSSFKGKKIFVCDENDKYLGFCELDDSGYIDRFYVAHDSVGKGVGKLLYKALQDSAKSNSIHELYTNASITAKPFFERIGFSVIREQKVFINSVEYTNYRMVKKLN